MKGHVFQPHLDLLAYVARVHGAQSWVLSVDGLSVLPHPYMRHALVILRDKNIHIQEYLGPEMIW